MNTFPAPSIRVSAVGVLTVLLTIGLFQLVDNWRAAYPDPVASVGNIFTMDGSKEAGVPRSPLAAGPRGFEIAAGTHVWEIPVPEDVRNPVLEIDRPDLDSVSVRWITESGDWQGGQVKRTTPLSERNPRSANPAFSIPETRAVGSPIVLEIRTSFPVLVNPKWWNDPNGFTTWRTIHQTFLGFYGGIIVIQILVNLFVFWSSRIRAYLWYPVFLFLHGVSIFTYEGFYAGTGLAEIRGIHQGLLVSIPLTVIFALKFLRDFLNLPRDLPRAYRFIRLFSLPFYLLLLQVFLLPFPRLWALILPLQSLFVLIAAVVYPAVAAVQARTGKPAHLLIFVTFIPHLVAVIAYMLQILGWMNPDPNYYYKLLASSLAEMLLISAALGLLINQTRREKEAANRDALENLQRAIAAETAYKTKLEEEVRERTAELKQANKDKDRLLSILAHDLRSPLNSVVRYSEFALRPGKEYSKIEYRDFLEGIHETSKTLYSLLENLLFWAKTNWGGVKVQAEPLNLREVVDKCLSLFPVKIRERSVRMEVDIPPDVEVHADREMLLTIVRNLLSNAFRHTRESGTVSISWTQIEGTGQLIIENEGDPVHPDVLERLASEEPGSVHERTSGLGLGLGLCSQLSQLQGGSFSIRATKSGTAAKVTLPMTRG
jgi:signal transduction histidine kinase